MKKRLNERDKYIIRQYQCGFTVNEIQVLLPREGFKPVSRQWLHKIIAAYAKEDLTEE